MRHRYLWGPAVDQLLADEQVSSISSAGNTIWPLADHLGTPRDLADRNESTGVVTIVNHRVYNSFGELESETNGSIDLLFGFTARYYDEQTKLQNNWNRWYIASMGQWMSEDPIGFEGGDENLRRYVGNHPTYAVDPGGLSEESAQIAGLVFDLIQIGLDIGGIFEPTPFCDGSNTVISVFRFQWFDAVVNAVGMVPYFGDTAKLAKLPKYLKTVAAVGEMAVKNADFAKRAKPPLEAIAKRIDNIPDFCPAGLRKEFDKLKDSITDALKKIEAPKDAPKPKSLPRDPFQGHAPTTTLETALKGTGNIRALSTNPNLKGIDVNSLLRKPLQEIKDSLTKKQWDTLKKHLNRPGKDITHGN